MEVYGNVDSLKESIGKKYDEDIAELDKQAEKIISDIKAQADKKKELMKARNKTDTEAEVKKLKSKVISEETLKAKKEFEKSREELIEKVFSEAEKKAKDTAKTKKYADLVKKKMPKKVDSAIVGNVALKKLFKGIKTWKTDKTIAGIKFVQGEVVYDFTLDSAIRARKDELREKVAKILFK